MRYKVYLIGEWMETKTKRHRKTDTSNQIINSAFYSMKKIITEQKREREVALHAEFQLKSALETLYEHLQRLERNKKDFIDELIQVSSAGSDFLMNRLTEQEREIEKAKTLAARYKQEKLEMEHKFEQWITQDCPV